MDVAPDSTFAVAIDCVAWYGITTGNTPTTYNPVPTVTRVQMAMFVQRLAEGLGAELDGSDAGFTDVDGVSDAGYFAINALANAGVVFGTSSEPKTYSPQAPVTRAQMAAYLNRLQAFLTGDYFPVSQDYFDDDNSSRLARDIDALAEAGIVSGTGQDRTYNPTGLVTRAQMAGFMARYLEVALTFAPEVPDNRNADLQAPTSLVRGEVSEFEYTFENPDQLNEGLWLNFHVSSEAGVTGYDVRLSVLDPTTNNWEFAPWEEEFSGERVEGGGVFTTGGWSRFPDAEGGPVTVTVRLMIPEDAPAGQHLVVSSLEAPSRGSQVVAETYDLIEVE